MQTDFLVQVILASLASWRVVHMLLSENGPFHVFYKIRQALGTQEDDYGNTISYKYEITICVYCLSVWVAMLAYFIPREILAILSISTIVIFVEKLHDFTRDTSKY